MSNIYLEMHISYRSIHDQDCLSLVPYAKYNHTGKPCSNVFDWLFVCLNCIDFNRSLAVSLFMQLGPRYLAWQYHSQIEILRRLLIWVSFSTLQQWNVLFYKWCENSSLPLEPSLSAEESISLTARPWISMEFISNWVCWVDHNSRETKEQSYVTTNSDNPTLNILVGLL